MVKIGSVRTELGKDIESIRIEPGGKIDQLKEDILEGMDDDMGLYAQ